MRGPRRFAAGWLLLAAGVALLGVAGIGFGAGGTSNAGSAEAALTDEDIVRRYVTGTSAAQLIALIESSPVNFDVSREMLAELRAAGLPDGVIQAMQRRQAEVDAANRPADEEEEAAGEAASTLVVLLNPDAKVDADPDAPDDDAKGLLFLDVVPPPLAESLRLDAEDRKFTDAAIFLGCTRTQHVPDHWRSKTPLGRDFITAPRHRLLAWNSGARKVERERKGKLLGKLAGPQFAEASVLELDIPDRLEGTPEPDETHDLVLGIALEAGGRFYLITADTWDNVSIDSDLSATVKNGSSTLTPQVEIRFKR